MQSFPTQFKDLNTSNVIVYTSLNTINTLHGIVKIIANLIHLDWKLSRINPAPTSSNVSTVEEITKQTLVIT